MISLIEHRGIVQVILLQLLKEENEQIKQGKIPERFTENANVLAQKDCDARWTKMGTKRFSVTKITPR